VRLGLAGLEGFMAVTYVGRPASRRANINYLSSLTSSPFNPADPGEINLMREVSNVHSRAKKQRHYWAMSCARSSRGIGRGSFVSNFFFFFFEKIDLADYFRISNNAATVAAFTKFPAEGTGLSQSRLPLERVSASVTSGLGHSPGHRSDLEAGGCSFSYQLAPNGLVGSLVSAASRVRPPSEQRVVFGVSVASHQD
jgi:hypothetical protein